MKKTVILSVVMLCICLCSCVTETTETTGGSSQNVSDDRPINISIFLDLSDRIIKDSNGMLQSKKDSIIVDAIVDEFIEVVIKHKIIKTKDKIKIYFYPTPSLPEINNVAKNLDVDFSKIKEGKLKKQQVQNLKKQFSDNLSTIYISTLNSKNWIGSDIWGFFEDRVKELCIQKGCRNIMIILTDGYIYHKNNKQVSGTNYSYITTQTLAVANSGLIPCKHSDLSDLEVMFLEIDAPVNHSKRIETILSEWLEKMNVSKYKIVKTDQPTNTVKIIENFLHE